MAYDLLGGYDHNKLVWEQLTPEERDLVEERWKEYWSYLENELKPWWKKFRIIIKEDND